MAWIDGAIGWLSPKWGLDRERARVALNVIRTRSSSFEAAKTGRRTDGWTASGTGPNAALGPGLHRLRDRARDLYRNDPYARRAVKSIVANMVGTGIQLHANTGDEERDQVIDRAWETSMLEIDADGRTSGPGLQAIMVTTMVVAGEFLARIRDRRPSDGLLVPQQWQVLEPDFLDTAKTQELRGGGRILQGVEFDAVGRRVAYWLFPDHPGEASAGLRARLTSRRVPAQKIIHGFVQERPGQVRGYSWLSASILSLREGGDLRDALLMRKKVEACLTAFVSEEGGSTIGEKKTQERIEQLEPGMIVYGPWGEGIQVVNPSSSGGFDEAERSSLQASSAGVGVTYHQMTGDTRGANYSSLKSTRLNFQAEIEAEQWNCFIPGVLAPLRKAWEETAVLAGVVPNGPFGTEYTPPDFVGVEPIKDATGDLIRVRSGQMDPLEAIRRQGYEPRQVLRDWKKFADKVDELDLVFDVDPRKVSRSGVGQSMDPVELGREGDGTNA